MSTHYETSVRL